jgi:hypothetical protein
MNYQIALLVSVCLVPLTKCLSNDCKVLSTLDALFHLRSEIVKAGEDSCQSCSQLFESMLMLLKPLGPEVVLPNASLTRFKGSCRRKNSTDPGNTTQGS